MRPVFCCMFRGQALEGWIGAALAARPRSSASSVAALARVQPARCEQRRQSQERGLGGTARSAPPAHRRPAFLLQQRLDARRQVARRRVAVVAADDLAGRRDQDLLEVPGHVSARHGVPPDLVRRVHQRQIRRAVHAQRDGVRGLDRGPKRVLVRAVDVHLGRQREQRLVAVARPHVLQRGQRLGIVSVFLVAELVARCAQHSELLTVRFHQGVGALVVAHGRVS
mmetsp:Transcript_29672/g.70027  ORF Transcript_29672/g.70027 Transcript_29672/m.70027 type:complete len:225 (-) Transcript_29672:239-913(-)